MTARRRLAALLLVVLTIVLSLVLLGVALFSEFSGQGRVNAALVGAAVTVAIVGILLGARITWIGQRR